MLPDIAIKDFYLQFIHNAKTDADKYKNKLDLTITAKDKCYEYIDDKKDVLKSDFNINLDVYEIEWLKKEYNPKEHLYNTLIKLLQHIEEHPNRIIVLQVIKYCNILRIEHRCRRMIALTEKRKNLKFGEYRKYVTAYYIKVHKCVLQGMGYKFSYGIGTYVCNHWKLDATKMKRKVHLDYAATNARKKELLAQGVKLYDEKEAAWYAARKIPYNGVDYRVWRENTDWYEFTFLKPQIVKTGSYDYQRTEYVAKKYRGMSYMQMADELCHTEEDIYNLQVDIKYKLNILLYKDPTKYLNYVRNAEQCKYQRGAHNS